MLTRSERCREPSTTRASRAFARDHRVLHPYLPALHGAFVLAVERREQRLARAQSDAVRIHRYGRDGRMRTGGDLEIAEARDGDIARHVQATPMALHDGAEG